MRPKQKSFLDDLAALCVKYHVEEIDVNEFQVEFISNGDPLTISSFYIDKITGKTCFTGVRSTENYYPDEPEETKYQDDDFDD